VRKSRPEFESILRSHRITGVVARQGSPFYIYFMDHEPRDCQDLSMHHNFAQHLGMRRRLIDQGIYDFPVETKQCSISARPHGEDLTLTLEALDESLKQ